MNGFCLYRILGLDRREWPLQISMCILRVSSFYFSECDPATDVDSTDGNMLFLLGHLVWAHVTKIILYYVMYEACQAGESLMFVCIVIELLNSYLWYQLVFLFNPLQRE